MTDINSTPNDTGDNSVNWVIVVDDDAANLRFAGRILSENGMRVTALKSGEKFLEYISNSSRVPDIVLLDVMMPQMDGFETLRKLREFETDNHLSQIPVVFLTADNNEQSEVKGLEMGGADYIKKPFRADVLISRITNIIRYNKKLITADNEATHDGLTGLYNKKSAATQIAKMCQKEKGYLCIADLDSFKLVNDIYGHKMGDKMIRLTSRIIEENLSQDSLCGRIGGDEFLIFDKKMQKEADIREFSNKVNNEITISVKDLLGDDVHIPLGMSLGAVRVDGGDCDFDELFRMADKALYTAKDLNEHGYIIADVSRLRGSDELADTSLNLKSISRLLEERNYSKNVMCMGRKAFSNVYRYMMRYFMRYNVSAYKVLFTIEIDETVDGEDREKIIGAFSKIIQVSLRNSDVMVQIGVNQFFMLIPEINKEQVKGVLDRVDSAWSKSSWSVNTKIHYEYESVSSRGDAALTNAPVKAKDRIVVVDDDAFYQKSASYILTKEGMDVICLSSGQELLDFVEEHDADLILLDIMMPNMNGMQTLEKLNQQGNRMKHIPVVFLTADSDIKTEAMGFANGAIDFIRKPFAPEILIARVKLAVNLIRLQNSLKDEVSERVEENERLSMHIIQALADAIDAKDLYTRGHSGRVAKYSRMIAKRFGYDEEAQNGIYMMGLLHDVGKIGISDAIINKNGPLSDEEYEVIKTHSEKGAKILGNITEMEGLVTGARSHHERYDGKGYPDGLAGEQIPQEARIIAVADAYDAMTSHRSYRSALPQDKVREQIALGKGTQFDPAFADIMLELIDEDIEYQMKEL